MEFLLKHLGENKVTQSISTNDFQQSITYDYKKNDIHLFEDLLKRKNKSFSSGSLSCESSNSLSNIINSDDTYIISKERDIFSILYYIGNHAVMVYTKDVFVSNLKEFKMKMCQDMKECVIKKLSKLERSRILSLLQEDGIVGDLDEYLLVFFAHYLRCNLIGVDISNASINILKGTISNEDFFDTYIIIKTDRELRLFKQTMRYDKAKEFLAENHYYNESFIHSLSATELKSFAKCLNIDLNNVIEGKKTKKLKEELKQDILKTI